MADDPDEYSGITAGELIEQLKMYPKDTPISFGFRGQFTFYRVKNRQSMDNKSGCIQIEFNEMHGKEADVKSGVTSA